MKQTKREMVLWEGSCIVHEAFSLDKLLKLIGKNPHAKIVAHPESEENILKVADFVGSTRKMIDYVRSSASESFIIATEAGILSQMQKEAPGKTLIPAPIAEDNTCACSECAFMKVNTLEKLYNCLLNEEPEITMSQELIEKAVIPLERMFEWS